MTAVGDQIRAVAHSTPSDVVDEVVAAAEAAAGAWAGTARSARSAALAAVADALDAHATELVEIAGRETHLPVPRLTGELQRTTFQLRYLGEYVAAGAYLAPVVDLPDPAWPMGAARPDLRRTHIPLGPVLNFAASNFPFAFSVAGGDTAAALAAGCPVIVKAHSGHPALSARVGELVTDALRGQGAPDGVFAVIHGQDAGTRALRDPRVRAASFTGSVPGGRALFDIASSRPEPIPFFGELGSVNPVFVTDAADAERGADIAAEYVASFTLGMGQFCTSPGILVVPENSRTLAALDATTLPQPQPMLNERIREGYDRAVTDLAGRPGVGVVARSDAPDDRSGAVVLHRTTAATVLADVEHLMEECFGPASLVVTYADDAERLTLAEALPGQLTATLQAEPSDIGPEIAALAQVLAQRAGRVLWNQWPTGVSVTAAQQHGGPYPASTAVQATSVGTAAVHRFVRPVAYQNFPAGLLPDELR